MVATHRSNSPKQLSDMNKYTGRQIALAARPSGKPKLTDFRLGEIAIPDAEGPAECVSL
jgi:hypothetical protein